MVKYVVKLLTSAKVNTCGDEECAGSSFAAARLVFRKRSKQGSTKKCQFISFRITYKPLPRSVGNIVVPYTGRNHEGIKRNKEKRNGKAFRDSAMTAPQNCNDTRGDKHLRWRPDREEARNGKAHRTFLRKPQLDARPRFMGFMACGVALRGDRIWWGKKSGPEVSSLSLTIPL